MNLGRADNNSMHLLSQSEISYLIIDLLVKKIERVLTLHISKVYP